jgi:hypothetical protein
MQKCGRALKERQLAIQFGWLLAQGIFAFTLHRNPRQISRLDKKPSTKVRLCLLICSKMLLLTVAAIITNSTFSPQAVNVGLYKGQKP